MDLTIQPGQALNGRLSLPGDKSLSHRAALFAALAEGESRIDNFLVAGVTRAMLQALTQMGVQWELNDRALVVNGPGMMGLRRSPVPLSCGNSATTMRMLAGALAASGISARLDGSEGLRRRPMDRIVAPLQRMGVPIRASEGGCAPLILDARPPDRLLSPLDYDLPIASAQVKTCLLLAALSASSTSTLREPESSRDHTERMLASMGIDLDFGEKWVTVRPSQPLRMTPLRLRLPGDISSAAFLIVAALITPSSRIILTDVLLNPGRTGLIDVLQAMGAQIEVRVCEERGGEPVGEVTAMTSKLHGTAIDGPLVVRMIDEFPAFAVAAAYATGDTVVQDAGELRHKESDRISALSRELCKLGAQVNESPDGFCVSGQGGLQGGQTVDPSGDHRLAMALAVAGLASLQPVRVQDAQIIAESFPDFASCLHGLGAAVTARA